MQPLLVSLRTSYKRPTSEGRLPSIGLSLDDDYVIKDCSKTNTYYRDQAEVAG